MKKTTTIELTPEDVAQLILDKFPGFKFSFEPYLGTCYLESVQDLGSKEPKPINAIAPIEVPEYCLCDAKELKKLDRKMQQKQTQIADKVHEHVNSDEFKNCNSSSAASLLLDDVFREKFYGEFRKESDKRLADALAKIEKEKLPQAYLDLCDRVREIDEDAAKWMIEEAPKKGDGFWPISGLGDWSEESQGIEDAFLWTDTPQGHEYWRNLHAKLNMD